MKPSACNNEMHYQTQAQQSVNVKKQLETQRKLLWEAFENLKNPFVYDEPLEESVLMEGGQLQKKMNKIGIEHQNAATLISLAYNISYKFYSIRNHTIFPPNKILPAALIWAARITKSKAILELILSFSSEYCNSIPIERYERMLTVALANYKILFEDPLEILIQKYRVDPKQHHGLLWALIDLAEGHQVSTLLSIRQTIHLAFEQDYNFQQLLILNNLAKVNQIKKVISRVGGLDCETNIDHICAQLPSNDDDSKYDHFRGPTIYRNTFSEPFRDDHVFCNMIMYRENPLLAKIHRQHIGDHMISETILKQRKLLQQNKNPNGLTSEQTLGPPYICETCKRDFHKHKGRYMKHIADCHHITEIEKIYEGECGRRFSTSQNVTRHYKSKMHNEGKC